MIARIIRDMELTFFDNNKEDLVLSKKVQGESVNRGKFLLFPISRLVSLDRIAVGKFICGKCVDSSFRDPPSRRNGNEKVFLKSENRVRANAIATVVKTLFDLDDSRSRS